MILQDDPNVYVEESKDTIDRKYASLLNEIATLSFTTVTQNQKIAGRKERMIVTSHEIELMFKLPFGHHFSVILEKSGDLKMLQFRLI